MPDGYKPLFIHNIEGVDYQVTTAYAVLQEYGEDGSRMLANEYVEVAESPIRQHTLDHEQFIALIEVQLDAVYMAGLVMRSPFGSHIKVYLNRAEAQQFLNELLGHQAEKPENKMRSNFLKRIRRYLN